MVKPLSSGHIQFVAGLIMLIGTFLFSSMVLIAVGNLAALAGEILMMFIVGCAAGMIITALGALLFFKPKLGQLGSD